MPADRSAAQPDVVQDFAKGGEVLSIETTYTESKVDGEVDEKVFEKPEEPAPAPAADAPAEEKKDDDKDGVSNLVDQCANT